MSHSLVLATFCTKAEVETINREISELQKMMEMSDIAKNYQSEFDDVIGKLKNTIVDLEKMNKQEQVLDDFVKSWYATKARELDSVMKLASNLKNSINLSKMTSEELERVSLEIQSLIRQHGTMVLDAMDSLKKQGLDVSSTSIESEISKIRNEFLDQSRLDQYQSFYRNEISKLSMPEEFKVALASEVTSLRSSQEVADFSAFIENKKAEYEKTIRLAKELMDSASKTLKFKLVDRAYKVIRDGDHIDDMRVVMKLRNQKNNVIGYSFSLKGSVEYQMGNYEGHMCDADAEVLMKELKNRGYNINVTSVTRNVSNSKPLQRAAKLNESEK
jgi:hypothetical protein